MAAECYMCDAMATSFEHVPPHCFFPEGYRANLITVPSCTAHNEKNSKDVEYVRNVISTQHGATNEAATKVFETTKRSFDRSTKLADRTFRDLRPVLVEGQETGAFAVDLARHISAKSIAATGRYSRRALAIPEACIAERQTRGNDFAVTLNRVTTRLCQYRNRTFSNSE